MDMSSQNIGVINTGIINHIETEDTKKYKLQIAKRDNNEPKSRKQRMEVFANFMYPDLNDREIFYLAELASFGKSELYDLKSVLEERSQRKELSKENGVELRNQYLKEQISRLETKDEQLSKINSLYSAYVETVGTKDRITLSEFKTILKESKIKTNTINDFINIEKEEKSKSQTYNYMLKSVEIQKTKQRKNIENIEQNIIESQKKER